jgi:hypothetical protein
VGQRGEKAISRQKIKNEGLQRVRCVASAEQDNLATCIKRVSLMRGKKIFVTMGEPLQGVSKRDITDRLQRKLVW